MPEHKDVASLRRRILIGQTAAGAVMLVGVVSLVLFFDPALVGLPGEQYHYYKSNWLWFGLGLGFITFGIFIIKWANSRLARLIWVYMRVVPVTMAIELERDESSDSTAHTISIKSQDGKTWTMPVMQPSWDTRSIEKQRMKAMV
jgi:hypothetical protein